MLVDAGRAYILKVATSQLTAKALNMGLYTNAVTWSRSTVLADLVEPSGGTGYVRQPTGPWQPPTVLAGGEGSTTAPSVGFTNTSASPVTVIGFFYISTDGSVFLGGDAFASPLTVPANTGTLNAFPQLIDTTYP